MQIWPWFMKAPKPAAATASSTSASFSTSMGDLPPSSRSTGFRCLAAMPAMIRPTLVEPVKLIRRTAGWAISASTTPGASVGALVTTLITPAGRPASRSTEPISQWVRGHCSDAFSTTVLPQASGTARARVPRMIGAFQGAMPTTTPTGWRIAMHRRLGWSEGITSPVMWVVAAAASRSMPEASMMLNRAQPSVAPTSVIIASTNSPARASMISAALLSRARRWFGPVSDQAGKAAWAASHAAVQSPGPAAAARVATSLVTGLRRSKVAPPDAGASLSPIRRPMSYMRGSLSDGGRRDRPLAVGSSGL